MASSSAAAAAGLDGGGVRRGGEAAGGSGWNPPTTSRGPRKISSSSSSSDATWQKNVLCKYCVDGVCSRGQECAWSHDRSLANKKTLPCKYFSAGTCAYGDNCRFSHGQQFPPLNPFAPEFKAPPDDSCSQPTATTAAALDDNNDSSRRLIPNGATAVPQPMGNPLSAAMPAADHSFSADGATAAAVSYHVPPTAATGGATAAAAIPPPPSLPPLSSMRLVASNSTGLPPKQTAAGSASSGGGGGGAVASNKKSWVDAPEFIPKANRTWAQIVDPVTSSELSIADAESQLCPFSMVGVCRYGEHCNYVHGMTCDMCGSNTLHPFHQRQREQHTKVCLKQHEAAMELAFSAQRSKDKTCGICMEVVMEKKPPSEARFGIMPNCNHCYCLPCLRKWRQAKQFEHKIVRACPECRVTSDYICPSKYWIDTKEEKDKLLANYKSELGKKTCKYFDGGKGECPFGNKCFYQHLDRHGQLVDVGPPQVQKRRVVRQPTEDDDDDDFNEFHDAVAMQRVLLQDFLQLRLANARAHGLPLDEVLDMLELFSDDDSDSDW